MKQFIIVFLLFSCCHLSKVFAQIAINHDNSLPDSSAILDVKSTNQGVLIPRMTTAQRTAINSPATGLMVYDNTTHSFWFHSDTVWTEITTTTVSSIQDADNDTKIQVEETADEDSIRIDIAGSERMVIRQSSTGATQLNFPNNNENTFIGQEAGQATSQSGFSFQGKKNTFTGYQSGYSNTTGYRNLFTGYKAGYSNTTGRWNVFNGHEAGYSNTSGSGNLFSGNGAGRSNTSGEENVFVGADAGYYNTTGYSNLFLGTEAGNNNTTGNYNTFLGYEAGSKNTTGNENTFIGNNAGNNNTTGKWNVFQGANAGFFNSAGSRNVYLGYKAGFYATGDDELYIENSTSNTPLIYGDFANDFVKIHGTLGIKNAYTFPITDGTAGQTLQTDGAGNTVWANKSSLADTDNDTKIQVEESLDEDSIRIDIAGSERMVIGLSPTGATQVSFPNNNENTFLGNGAGQASVQSGGLSSGRRNNFTGYHSGFSNTTGGWNVFNGFEAGYSNISGSSNVFSGVRAGKSNTSGFDNVFIGTQAGLDNTTGHYNVFLSTDAGASNTTGYGNTFIGVEAGYRNTSGRNNIFLGTESGIENTTGNENIFIGYGSGYNNTVGKLNIYHGINAGANNSTGNRNVYLGYNAGYNASGDDKLYIENSNSATPLIYGDFANDTVKIHGTLGIKDAYSFPIVDGTVGQLLQTDGSGNIAWGSQSILSDADNDTKIQVEATADEDSIRIDIAGSERMVIGLSSTGATQIGFPNNNKNTFLGEGTGQTTAPGGGGFTGDKNTFTGYHAGYSNTSGFSNAFTGFEAGYSNTTGKYNVFNGPSAGRSNTTGQDNLFLGRDAGYDNTSGNYNIILGTDAGSENISGSENTFIGRYSGYYNTTGEKNLFLGPGSGTNNTTGNNNIYLGYNAGYNETGSDKLYIENSDSSTPLIYGDFANDTVKINGTLAIKDAYAFPMTDGTVGQTLQTDGSGNTSWGSQSILSDTDNDTKIQIEESTDEDKVRIDLANEERIVIEKAINGATIISLPNNNGNTFIGENAGRNTELIGIYNNFLGFHAGFMNTSGSGNIFNGSVAGYSNTTGSDNIFIGFQSGASNTTGNNNILIGCEAGAENTQGNNNVMVGYAVGNFIETGNNNTYFGTNAGFSNESGNNNVILGNNSGYSNESGSNNILLGNEAGYNELGSDKLYIENSNSSTPLIYGDFANDTVKIHGTLGIKDAYSFPNVDGNAGQFLHTDGAGNISWASTDSVADNQMADVFQLNGNNLELSIENDGIATQSIDLSSINSDNQKTDVFQLNGNNLELSIENDGVATQSVDLSSFNTTKTLIADSDNDTKIQVEESTDEDNIRIDIDNSERMVIGLSLTGATQISFPNNNENIFLGEGAGQATSAGGGLTGAKNTFIGYHAGNSNASGDMNLFNGNSAGYSNTTGRDNVFSGYQAGKDNISGSNNLFDGSNAGAKNTTGSNNVFTGNLSGFSNTTGNYNTYLGSSAGGTNLTGNSNVFIGYDAGLYELGSEKLYIENSDSSTPLIYGDFANDTVKIYGTLGVKDVYSFPNIAGTAGQVLQTDGAGNTAWTSPAPNTDNQKTDVFQLNGNNLELSLENDGEATQSIDLSSINTTKALIADTDNDTKIQVEESADEDKIRFDLAGSEQLAIEQNSHGNTMLNLPNNNGNIFFGNDAGLNEAGSNKLYIENSNSSTPLIYGEFDNDALTINGTLTATGITHANAGINFPNSFAPDTAYIGTSGNFISFAHFGVSEDFLGYKNNAFYFRDSPNGGDTAQPSVHAAAFTTYSSRRWKHNVKNLNNALAVIQKLRGVSYTWNEDQGNFDDFGFIAEEVNEVLPQIAKKGKDGKVDGVEYGKVTPYLVEAIKEQQVQIQELKNKNKDLNTQLQLVMNRLDALENKK